MHNHKHSGIIKSFYNLQGDSKNSDLYPKTMIIVLKTGAQLEIKICGEFFFRFLINSKILIEKALTIPN